MESDDISVQKCLKLLRNAKSDNEKLAALMFVTKVLKAENCDTNVRTEIAEAIGFGFLHRLLKTEAAPEECQTSMFTSVALSVLSAFSQEASVVNNPGFVEQIPEFCRIIALDPSSVEDAEEKVTVKQLIDDSYECIHILARLNSSSLIEAKVIPTLCECFMQKLYGSEKAFGLLVYIVEKCGLQSWADNSVCLQSLMTMLVTSFHQEQTQIKFEVCTKLSQIISEVPKEFPKPWLPKLVQTLRDILQSKIGEQQREPTLHLVAALVNNFGLTCLLPPQTEEYKLLLLVVHLVAVEVRMIVEVEDFDKVSSKENLLSSCFTVLEQAISYLSGDAAVMLEPKQIRQVHSALVGAFNGILFFLSFVSRDCPHRMLELVVIGSVRVLGSWLAEETAALRKEVYEALPFLLKISKATFPSVKETGSHDQVCTLQFLLPGLCHLTAEDEPRAILLQGELHVLLAQYFSYLWTEFTCHQKSQTQMTLRTLCGVLLNLSVLETELVKSHPVFTELMTLLCGSLVVLVGSTHTVLLANLVTLGLMIGRHPQIKQAVDQSQMRHFFSSVIIYLSQIYTVQQTTAGSKLVLCDRYKSVWDDVSELWFLATQALSSCVEVYPELSEIVLSSDWLPKLVKQVAMTTDVNTESEFVDAYLTLLTQFAKSHPGLMKVVLDNGGLQLARTLGNVQLEQALN